MPSSSQIQWACYKQTGMCQWSTSTFENSCGCTALDKPEWRETTEQIDWRAKPTITRGLRLGGSKVLRSLSHYLRAQSQGHHTIDHLEEREAWEEEALDDLPWKDKRGPSSIRRTFAEFESSVRQGVFLPESTSSADSLTVSVQPPVCNRRHHHLCAR